MSSDKVKIEASGLESRVFLCKLESTFPSGWKTLKQVGETIANHHRIKNGRRTRGTVNIFCTPELEEAKNHAKRCRNEFDLLNPSWDGGMRIVSKNKIDIHWDWADSVTAENQRLFNIAIESILEQKERDRIELSEGEDGSVYDANLYPSEAALRDKYTFKFKTGVIPDPSQDVRVGSSPEQVERFRRELTNQQDDIAKEAHLTLVKRVEEQLLRVIDRMEKYNGKKEGSFNDTLLPNLVQIATVMRDVNIYNDPAVEQIAKDAIDRFNGIDASDLRSDEGKRASTKQAASKLVADLANLKSSKY
jgi:hypothetical protein